MVVATKLMHALGETDSPHSGPASEVAPRTSSASGLEMGVLFNRILDAIVVAKLSTGTIVLWNAAAEKLFGYSAAEAIGKPIEILMPEPIGQYIAAAWPATSAPGTA
jgi:PAS domain-containing protein